MAATAPAINELAALVDARVRRLRERTHLALVETTSPTRTMTPLRLLSAAVVGLAACASPTLSREQLLDPQTCAACHQGYVTDWSGSMHAYAADDPVFRAMNARGQRETSGQLGSFCVNCHAPMAVKEGATADGLNLDTVPAKLHGVTCYFCHDVTSVAGTHDNPLTLANDEVMRGPFSDPVSNSAHHSDYSILIDGSRIESSGLCGACHDVVTPLGGAIERTFMEWQQSVYNMAPNGRTCGQCHMDQSATLVPIADAPGVFARRAHSHQFPGVDLALTPAPETAAQQSAVQTFLDSTVQSAVCVAAIASGTEIRVLLDNVASGHSWPSGAAQDRRAWVEVIAYSANTVLYQSGVVADGIAVTSTTTTDPDLWLLRDCMYGANGAPVDMFWQAASYQGVTLPGQATFNMLDPRFYQTHLRRSFPADGSAFSGVPDRVTVRVRLRPVGLDVLDDLVTSGDLDASVPAQMTTFDVASTPTLEWTPAAATTSGDTYIENGLVFRCVSNTNLSGATATFAASTQATCGL